MLPQIHILGVTVKTYGLAVVFAYVAALALLVRRAREVEVPIKWATEGALAGLVGGLVGARVYFLIQHHSELHGFWGGWLTGGGLVWYGGLIGGALSVLVWSRRRGVPLYLVVDSAGPVVALVQAIGRIGCQLAGDGDYGKPSSLPWAMAYPHGTVPTPPGVRVQPTPVYETVVLGLIALWLWRRRDAFRPGTLFAAYLVLAGIERFLVEFIRRNAHVFGGLTAPQLESIALIAAGSTWLLVAGSRFGLRRTAPATT